MSADSRVLHVSINECPVGELRELNDLWSFEYDARWLQDPQAFSLSPGLPMSTPLAVDGSSIRPVQWYFDNLLPEELLREVLAKEAKLDNADAFGLLEHFGAESAGSLVLQAPGASDAAHAINAHPQTQFAIARLPVLGHQ